MTRAELRYIIARHEKWLRHPDSGERADLREADLDFSAWPLWCGSLHAKADDRLVIQLLFHTLALAQGSEISDELKKALDTDAIIDQANRFHREKECGKLIRWAEEESSHERTGTEAEPF